MSGIEDNSGWSESPDAEYDLMTVAQHNRIVEQFKRDAERWAWYRLGFADPDQLDKDADDIMRREALNQQQAEVKL